MPAGQPDVRRWGFNMLLGKHELRMGDEERALVHYRVAYEQLEILSEEFPLRQILRTAYELGVAYLRTAETQNCVAHHTAESCIFPIRGAGTHINQEGARDAIHCFTEILKIANEDSYFHVKSRWLLNIAYMALGEYPDGVPAEYLLAPKTFESDESFPRFREIAPSLGINSVDLWGGAVGDDFDGDGFLDLLVSSNETQSQIRLYRNNGDGTFTERTDEAGLTGLTGGLNIIQADYDNDGHLDAFVLRGAWLGGLGRHPNSLLHNNGDGTFTDVTFDSGLAEENYPTQTAAWSDYDNDGDLDLYVGNEFDESLDAPCQLFRNNGDGTFTDIAGELGVENGGFAKSVVGGDYDGDGRPDLFVSNMGSDNRLYHNNADGTFTDVAAAAGVTRPDSSFVAWFWDFDNDGALDLFVAAYGSRSGPDLADVAASILGIPHHAIRVKEATFSN